MSYSKSSKRDRKYSKSGKRERDELLKIQQERERRNGSASADDHDDECGHGTRTWTGAYMDMATLHNANVKESYEYQRIHYDKE